MSPIQPSARNENTTAVAYTRSRTQQKKASTVVLDLPFRTVLAKPRVQSETSQLPCLRHPPSRGRRSPTPAAYATGLHTAAWQLLTNFTLLRLFLVVISSQLYGKYKPSARLLAMVAFAPDDMHHGWCCILSEVVLESIGGGREACGLGEERQGGRLDGKMAFA
jgi:hypothetical protein